MNTANECINVDNYSTEKIFSGIAAYDCFLRNPMKIDFFKKD